MSTKPDLFSECVETVYVILSASLIQRKGYLEYVVGFVEIKSVCLLINYARSVYVHLCTYSLVCNFCFDSVVLF